jgi:tRNA A37 threonylcarbamoyladenosine modification protein TsaB
MGLSAGWGVPLKGVSTLRVIASLLPEGPVLSCIRARKGEVFAGAFSSPDPGSDELIQPGLYTSVNLHALLEGTEYSAAGSGRAECFSPSGTRWASSLLDSPRPSAAAVCAAAEAEAKGFDQHLEPFYLRRFNEKI